MTAAESITLQVAKALDSCGIRRREVQLYDQRVWLPSPEDVVVTKLRWARGKDRDDARDVMAVQRNRLDWDYIEDWCRRHSSLCPADGNQKCIA